MQPGECVVWWARPTLAPVTLAALLDDDERQRCAELRRAEDRARRLTGAALLRIVAGRALDLPPAAVRVTRDCPDCPRPHGKPRLPGTGLECSVAHAGDRVVVALAAGDPVGVDVEVVPPPGRLDDVLAAILSPDEAARVARLDRADRPAALVGHWTAREAVVKATGEGLRTDLRAVALSRAEVVALHPGPGYRAHLAVLGRRPDRVREEDGSPLLR